MGDEVVLGAVSKVKALYLAGATLAGQIPTSHTDSDVELTFYGYYLAVETGTAAGAMSDLALARLQILGGRTTISPSSCFINDVLGPGLKICR